MTAGCEPRPNTTTGEPEADYDCVFMGNNVNYPGKWSDGHCDIGTSIVDCLCQKKNTSYTDYYFFFYKPQTYKQSIFLDAAQNHAFSRLKRAGQAVALRPGLAYLPQVEIPSRKNIS